MLFFSVVLLSLFIKTHGSDSDLDEGHLYKSLDTGKHLFTNTLSLLNEEMQKLLEKR